MDKARNYLGIARKAGKLEMGEEASGAAVRRGKAKLLALACDASDNARARAAGFVRGKKTPLIELPYTKDEIAGLTGKGVGCSMLAVTDIGLSSHLASALRAGHGEQYGEVSVQLAARNAKALRRKAEARAHDRNKKTGKGRTKI